MERDTKTLADDVSNDKAESIAPMITMLRVTMNPFFLPILSATRPNPEMM